MSTETLKRDAIDFNNGNVTDLFKKMFFPTLLGMLSIVCLTIADGVFVGQGIGSKALAAVNIVAPVFMITTGINLLFGVGASVIASIHLSQGKIKAANIIITQAIFSALFFIASLGCIALIWEKQTAYLLGSSDMLLPQVIEYMSWIIPALILSVVTGVGLFIIRLDGSPKFAMMCNIIPAILNIALDYIFVFPLNLGLMGAALATGISLFTGSAMVAIYLIKYTKILNLHRIKISINSFKLTLRNIGYMARIGSSSMLGEVAIASMMLVGNYMFLSILQEDGVAAYSVMCYCFPIIFMVSNAIAHSAQPIISYNYGIGRAKEIRKTFILSIKVALFCGITLFLAMFIFCPQIVALFLDPTCLAYRIAVDGIPYFTLGFVFFALNIAWIGYYQSIEKSKKATLFMILRGIIIMTICFTTLPSLLGEKGLWLAIPVTEFIVFIIILVDYLLRQKNDVSAKL